MFLYDLTGNMGAPWQAAGYEVHIVDIQHPRGRTVRKDGIVCWGVDLRNGWLPPREITDRLKFAGAWPPCDHLAVSGSRWFRGKGLRALASSIDMFATAAEVLEWCGVPYFIENPVSTIASYWRPSDYRFDPFQFSNFAPEDWYTKKTCLWVGNGFVMPDFDFDEARYNRGKAQVAERKRLKDPSFPCPDYPDDRIHACPPGQERANIRSATPMGFAKAVFKANSL